MLVHDQSVRESFTEFVRCVEMRLQSGLIARYGRELGREAAAEAQAWAWEHWERVETMENPTGYLYRVATSRVRRLRRSGPFLPEVRSDRWPWVEPGLTGALRRVDRQTAHRGAVGPQLPIHPRGGGIRHGHHDGIHP